MTELMDREKLSECLETMAHVLWISSIIDRFGWDRYNRLHPELHPLTLKIIEKEKQIKILWKVVSCESWEQYFDKKSKTYR